MALQKNDRVPLTITALSSDGNGVGRFDGQAVFVPFTAVGDVITAHIVKVCKSHAYGIVQEIAQPGPGRIAPDCTLHGKCGGCCFRHLSYEAELAAKQTFVEDAMRRLGGLDAAVLPILPSPSAERYRNKVQYPLTVDAEGNVQAGFYAPRSHRVLPCGDCKLQPQLLNEIARTVCRLLTELKISVYSEAAHNGFVRHLYLRHAVTTDKVLCCLVCNGRKFPHREEFCRRLVQAHPQVDSVVCNVNTRDTNVIIGEECITLYGAGLLADTLSGVPVELSPLSFYQVNTRGAERLYAEVRRMAALTGTELLLDLYCGAGTIGLSMADACRQLVGVEIVPQAVENARANAARMGAQNTEFLCADAAEAARDLAARVLRPDVVVLDPPRKGCGPAALAPVLAMGPRRIVMVSCNPATAARDAAWLVQNGYQAEAVRPVDLFPRTRHVETVVLFSLKKTDSVINAKVEFGEGEGKVSLDKIAKRAEAYKPKERVTYKMIKEYIEAKYGFKVHTAYIAEVKRELGLPMYDAPNAVEELKQPRKHPTAEKVEAIKDALRHFSLYES